MKKKHKPNSHEHNLRRDTRPKSVWSELPLDLLSLVFERLGLADFQRGNLVCSSWYSASRQSVPKNQIPWLILFPEQNNNNNNCCTLFNPEQKDKLYKTQDLGLGFAKSVCQATYGNWLLMQDPLFNLYIVNLFTHDRINLPPVESQLGTIKIERHLDDWFIISNDHKRTEARGVSVIRYPVFWIDDKTKDYVVVGRILRGSRWCVVYSKNLDTSWKQIPETSHCVDMAYKDHKLYFLSHEGCVIKIFDFSEEIPRETFQCVKSFETIFGFSGYIPLVYATKLVVTVTGSGDVLRVQKRFRYESGEWSFGVYKFYSSGLVKNPEKVDSLGDEAMLFDLGITVLANGLEGLKRNFIYFNRSHEKNPNDEIVLFNLETQETEKLHEFDGSSSFRRSTARWFLPSFTKTID